MCDYLVTLSLAGFIEHQGQGVNTMSILCGDVTN